MPTTIARRAPAAAPSVELNRDMSGANLEDQFKSFERESEGNAQLAALKAKMGLGATVFDEQKQTQKQAQTAPATAGRGTWDTDDF
jgi:phage shock protein A